MLFKDKRYLGRFLALINSFIAAMMFFISRASSSISIKEKVYYRNFFNLIWVFIILKYKNINIFPENKLILKVYIMRGLFGGLVISFMFISLVYNSLQTFSVLFATRIFFIQIQSVIFLGEKLNFKRIILSIISFLGILLVIFPDFLNLEKANKFNTNKILYSLFPILASISSSTNQVMIRKFKDKLNPFLNLFYFSLLGVFFANLFFAGEIRVFFSYKEIIQLFGIIFCGFGLQYIFLLAIQYEKPSINSIIFNFNIVISFIFDIFILNSNFEYFSLIGALLIVTVSIWFLLD